MLWMFLCCVMMVFPTKDMCMLRREWKSENGTGDDTTASKRPIMLLDERVPS